MMTLEQLKGASRNLIAAESFGHYRGMRFNAVNERQLIYWLDLLAVKGFRKEVKGFKAKYYNKEANKYKLTYPLNVYIATTELNENRELVSREYNTETHDYDETVKYRSDHYTYINSNGYYPHEYSYFIVIGIEAEEFSNTLLPPKEIPIKEEGVVRDDPVEEYKRKLKELC